ncbi:hypothetical protein [Clostridium sp.]|uniref:hypothetical protein n=1 Tax=Clostridium sp. TaxID=1506 RepID=UPI0026196F5F|nr:hypothetical protein [Clostridium sp.]
MKKKIFIVLGIIIVLALGITAYIVKNKSGYSLTITNKTKKEITGLQISYGNNSYNLDVPSIAPNKSVSMRIKTNTNGSLFMYYTDIIGNYHKEILSGYYQKGAKGKINVNITAQDNLGVYGIEVESPEAEQDVNGK